MVIVREVDKGDRKIKLIYSEDTKLYEIELIEGSEVVGVDSGYKEKEVALRVFNVWEKGLY